MSDPGKFLAAQNRGRLFGIVVAWAITTAIGLLALWLLLLWCEIWVEL